MISLSNGSDDILQRECYMRWWLGMAAFHCEHKSPLTVKITEAALFAT